MIQAGQQLGRYQLLEPVGSGGMAVVYRGRDVALERDVAVKVLHPHLAKNPDARERFAREARAVARLRHPNIVEVYDVSEPTAPDAYLVTEYIRGATLKDFLLQHPLRLPEAGALVARAVAAALHHAHTAQVLHRDVKPENIMVREEDGQVKLMDFGIARMFDRDERMTQTGTLMGSPAHMAPEIIEGKEPHYPSDVFAAGTLLYLMLTGHLPFEAANTSALLQRILQGEYEDARRENPATTDPLAAVVDRCLARTPEARFANAGALMEALDGILRDAGLDDPDVELRALLMDPGAFQARLQPQLVARRLKAAQSAISQRRMGAALSALNLLLALQPSHAEGLALLASVRRRQRRHRRKKRLAIAAACLLTLGGAGLWAARHRSVLPVTLALVQRAPRRAPHAALIPGAPRLLEAPAHPVRPASVPHPAAPPAVPTALAVSVLIRPYGILRVDDAPPSNEALAQHALQLLPGTHRLTVSCPLCEDVTETVEVRAGEENVFHLRAQLRPSQVAFRYQPASAQIRVGDEARIASETAARPFQVESPRGPPTFRHRVEYEVSAPGYRTVHRTILVEPGKRTLVEGTLEPS